jgi:hypothetical protein
VDQLLRTRRRFAFVLIELAAILVLAAVVLAVLLVLMRDTRRHARLGECLANLRQFGAGSETFWSDNAGAVATFSWRRTDASNPRNPSTYTDLQTAVDDLDAASCQAVDILRRRGNRPDIPRINGWVPHILYSHLVLQDYLGRALADTTAICPEDKNRLRWAADPLGFDACRYPPQPACGDPNAKRWPYSSSYQMQPSFYSPDAAPTVSQSPLGHRYYQVSTGMPWGRRAMAQVAFPSQKVMVFEQHSRHFGPRVPFYAYPEARCSMLTADGAVAVRKTADANRGWDPSRPTNPSPSAFPYSPDPAPNNWEPPTLSGAPSDPVVGYYQWTKRGLGGRDFGAPEVP